MNDKVRSERHARLAATEERSPRTARPSLLWFAFLGGAAAWFLHHSLGYGLVEINCHSNRLAFEILGADASLVLGLLVTGIATLAALAAGLTAMRVRPPRRLHGEVEQPGAEEGRGRVRFMAYVGALLSLLFLLAILVGSSAFLFLRPC